MKIFRHTNGFLYSIEQIGKGQNITPNTNWNTYIAVPYKTNKNAPQIDALGTKPDLTEFKLEFEI